MVKGYNGAKKKNISNKDSADTCIDILGESLVEIHCDVEKCSNLFSIVRKWTTPNDLLHKEKDLGSDVVRLNLLSARAMRLASKSKICLECNIGGIMININDVSLTIKSPYLLLVTKYFETHVFTLFQEIVGRDANNCLLQIMLNKNTQNKDQKPLKLKDIKSRFAHF